MDGIHLISISEFCRRTSWSESKVRRHINRRDLPAFQIRPGTAWRIDWPEFEQRIQLQYLKPEIISLNRPVDPKSTTAATRGPTPKWKKK